MKLPRVLRMSSTDLLMATEAIVWALPVEIGLRCAPLDAVVARLGKAGRSARGLDPHVDIERAARLIDALAAYYPLDATCLKKSLILFRILRRRGVPAELRLGVRKVNDEFSAHAWLECDGHVLLGEGMTELFSPLPDVTRTD